MEGCRHADKEIAVIESDTCSYGDCCDKEVVFIVSKVNTSEDLHPLNRYKTKHHQHGTTEDRARNDLSKGTKLRKESKENQETSCVVDWQASLDT